MEEESHGLWCYYRAFDIFAFLVGGFIFFVAEIQEFKLACVNSGDRSGSSSTGLSNSLIDIRHAAGDGSDTHKQIYAPRAASMSAPKGHEALWGSAP